MVPGMATALTEVKGGATRAKSVGLAASGQAQGPTSPPGNGSSRNNGGWSLPHKEEQEGSPFIVHSWCRHLTSRAPWSLITREHRLFREEPHPGVSSNRVLPQKSLGQLLSGERADMG